MNQLYGIILTIVTGLFFLIGGFISLKIKDKNKLNAFSVALAFVIMLNLICFDLMPEVLELLESKNLAFKIILIVVFLLVGILVLKILDCFIPDHHHEHHDGEANIEEHNSHVKHIGTLTVISLILHNIIEGFAIFGMTLNDFKIGLFVCLSVALHNIPLGTQIFSSINIKNNKLLLSILTLSSLIGGIIFLIIGEVSNIVLAIIMIITVGMLVYIALGELLGEVLVNKDKKETKWGILVGVIILVISLFI